MRWLRLSLSLVAHSVVSPATGIALVRVAWRFRERKWYMRFPFLPTPSREYVRWRMYTAYGSSDAIPPAAEVARYALWAVREP